VGISLPNGSANKEFIQNLAGNYIIWNNSENTVQGGSPSTVGFDGDIITVCNPVSLDEPSDNGKSWSVNYWFNFKRVNMFTVLYYDHRKFFDLLNKTGMVGHGNFPFINNYQKYTVFAPSDEAIVNSQADTLDRVDLVKFIKNHFVQGALIFTDNKQPSGNYSTAGGGILDIQTGPDVIQVLDKAGNPYVAIQEQENTTNIMVSEVSTVSAVVHEIDKVLIPN
jgi:hypothetical protein